MLHIIRHPFLYLRARIVAWRLGRRYKRMFKGVLDAVNLVQDAEERWGGEPPCHCKESLSGLEDSGR
jgi:hypothetical protein